MSFDDDEVDSVGGLMAKHLGKVPIPGSTVEVDGWQFMAEETKGRRNRIGTVLITPVVQPEVVPLADERDRGRQQRKVTHLDLSRVSSLPPEDNKLVVLARATRARTGAAEGAALRDLDGRTYAGATVDLPSLQVSAIGVVIAMAVASGAKGAEAVVVLTEGEVVRRPTSTRCATSRAPGVPVHPGHARLDRSRTPGIPRRTLSAGSGRIRGDRIWDYGCPHNQPAEGELRLDRHRDRDDAAPGSGAAPACVLRRHRARAHPSGWPSAPPTCSARATRSRPPGSTSPASTA